MRFHLSDILRVCVIACMPVAVQATACRTDTVTVATSATWHETSRNDSVISAESILSHEDSLRLVASTDSVAKKARRDWATWRPNPKRALWLALVLPGAGQIYNRKYWKIPIVYGGFVGCIYAMQWNNQMYRDYSQAYLDIMDDDPNTQSYNQFLHLGNKIDDTNIERYKKLFKSRKDRYRRWRDMSFFVRAGADARSVIDAYVDASLSEFDISKNLSLSVEPTIMNNYNDNRISLKSNSIGVSCSLNF